MATSNGTYVDPHRERSRLEQLLHIGKKYCSSVLKLYASVDSVEI